MSLHLAKKRSQVPIISSSSELCTLLGCDGCIFEKIVSNPKLHYTYMTVPKRDNTTREIRPPNFFLKAVQRRLLKHFYRHLRMPPYLHGGLPKRSIVTHAQMHVGQYMVATFDIRDFYPCTARDHIEPVLFEAGFRGQALSAVVSLVLLDDGLPQGAPTSGLLANLGFIPADRLIMRLCRRHLLRYTRFVDDLAISGASDVQRWLGGIKQIVASFGFRLAEDKTRFYRKSERQIVTGLVVNDKLRPTKEFIRELKRRIRYCLEVGADARASIEGVSVGRLRQQLNGQVSHVRHVDRDLGEAFRRLLYGVEWARKPAITTAYRQLA